MKREEIVRYVCELCGAVLVRKPSDPEVKECPHCENGKVTTWKMNQLGGDLP